MELMRRVSNGSDTVLQLPLDREFMVHLKLNTAEMGIPVSLVVWKYLASAKSLVSGSHLGPVISVKSGGLPCEQI